MKMKKVIAIVSAACLMTGFVGCGDEDKIVGEWQSKRAEVAGASEAFTSVTMSFRDNGEVKYSIEGVSEVYEWELDGDKVIVDDYEFVLEDENTLVQEESGTKIYFEKTE